VSAHACAGMQWIASQDSWLTIPQAEQQTSRPRRAR
jgi:hypothetical protein